MKQDQDSNTLQKIADSEFDRLLTSPWSSFQPEAVRDELIRRLKLNSSLSPDDKKLKFKKIVERFREEVAKRYLDQSADDLAKMDFSYDDNFILRLQAQKDEMIKYNLLMHERAAQSDDPFTGKSKPGDWRPKGSELCPVCDGNGTGVERRICRKCSGRGFIRS